MTKQDAIKGLKALSKEFSGYKPNEEMFDMAISALEKQIPKKPKHVITNMGINGNFRRECPSCGWLMFERVTTKDASEPVVCRIFNFCQSCGQRIDWGES